MSDCKHGLPEDHLCSPCVEEAYEKAYGNMIELEKLRDENKKLRKCVEFYAGMNWGIASPGETVSIDPCDHEDKFHQGGGILRVGGKLARNTLKEIDEAK